MGSRVAELEKIRNFLTGQALTTTLGSLAFTGNANVFPTGVGATINPGIPTVFAYNEVDTGTPVSYSSVSTGTEITYTEVKAS